METKLLHATYGDSPVIDRKGLWICLAVLGLCALVGFSCSPNGQVPPVTTTTTITPAPSPMPCFAPKPGPDGDYVGAAWQPSVHLWAVLDVREAIGRYTCWPKHEDVGLELLASNLRAKGLCATKDEDRVLVAVNETIVEEMHALRYDTGCWASGERIYKGRLAWQPKVTK